MSEPWSSCAASIKEEEAVSRPEEPAGVMDKHRPKRPTTLDLFPRRQAQTGSQVGHWEGPAASSISMGGSLWIWTRFSIGDRLLLHMSPGSGLHVWIGALLRDICTLALVRSPDTSPAGEQLDISRFGRSVWTLVV